MTTRTNKLYNYLVNTYGLSKEVVLKEFQNRVVDLVSKHVVNKLDSDRIEHLILERVTHHIRTGFGNNYYEKDSFEKIVKECMRSEVNKIIKENYQVEIKLK